MWNQLKFYTKKFLNWCEHLGALIIIIGNNPIKNGKGVPASKAPCYIFFLVHTKKQLPGYSNLNCRVSQNWLKMKKLLYSSSKWFIPLYGFWLDTKKNWAQSDFYKWSLKRLQVIKEKSEKYKWKFWLFSFSFFGHVNEFSRYFKARGCIDEVMPVP